MVRNNNCDGSYCEYEHGEIRRYELSSGAGLFFCEQCFAHENAYNAEMVKQGYSEEAYPQQSWDKAEKVYDIMGSA